MLTPAWLIAYFELGLDAMQPVWSAVLVNLPWHDYLGEQLLGPKGYWYVPDWHRENESLFCIKTDFRTVLVGKNYPYIYTRMDIEPKEQPQHCWVSMKLNRETGSFKLYTDRESGPPDEESFPSAPDAINAFLQRIPTAAVNA
jgi:hypothetical protein